MNRLGSRQLDVLRNAALGKASTHHASQGRMTVSGVTDTYDDGVLDRLLSLHLVRLGEELIAGHRLVLTAEGWAELERRGEGLKGHSLRIGRRALGHAPIAGWGGSSYGTEGRCDCSWRGKINEPPSGSGEWSVRTLHGEHLVAITS